VGEVKGFTKVVPHPGPPVVEDVRQADPEPKVSVAIPTSSTDLPKDSVLLLLGVNLNQISTTLPTLPLGLIPRRVPLLEEIASGVERRPWWITVAHTSDCCLGVRTREASSATCLLTRAGACRRLRSSAVGGFHPALASLVGRVVRPVGARGFPEAEKSASLLVDPLLAGKRVSPILHILLNDTP